MWHISDFNKDTDEFLLDKRFIHRERCIRTKRILRKDTIRFYHYIYEVCESGILLPVVEAVSDREYSLVLKGLWAGIKQSPYWQQKYYEQIYSF